MIDCERCWTVLQKIQCKTLINVFFFWWMCMSSTVEASVSMGKNYSDNWQSIKNTGKSLTVKQMFEISEKLIFEQSGEIFGVSNQLGNFSMETTISGHWRRSHQSLASKGSSTFGFCVMSWKDESEPNMKYCLWTAVGLVQRFITIIRVEYCPRNHYIAARPRSPKVHLPNVRTRTIPRTNHLHFDVQWHHMVLKRQWNGMCCLFHTCVVISQKISSRTLVILRIWIRNKVVFC